MSTTQQYTGTTTKLAQISAIGTCTGNDGVSVTSWGTLPASYLAYTCVYYRTSTGVVLSSDILIDNKVHKMGNDAACQLHQHLRHRVGRGTRTRPHGRTVPCRPVTHASQVMRPKSPPCSTSKRMLAVGDLAGLQVLY